MANTAHSRLSYAANEIRSADAVVVMGAGVSFAAGMPLAGQLAPIVWHALDANQSALKGLCAELAVSLAPAKNVVADDPRKVTAAFRHIKTDPDAYRTFQRSICDLDSSRGVAASMPHAALARLVHAGKVVEVVSFNWDTLLETAFRQRYGFEINAEAPILAKPHGDCRHLDAEWILPHQPGLVPVPILARLAALAVVRPRVLLIVGYSERDAEVVKQLIQPLANRWRVLRISPSATGEGAIPIPAAAALEELAAQLAPEPDVPGWSIVTFANQRGIEAAVAGERLGPRDVEACPRLPHFPAASEKLSLLHAVEIAGDSGSGKSITVWQLAHELHQQGWQVLRLEPNSSIRSLDALRTQRWRTVAVIDDSQIYPREILGALRELANDRLKVIFGTTDASGEQHGAIRAAARNAVDALAAHARGNRDTFLKLVGRFDSHVGDGFLEERIESRIDRAAKEQTPWQFAYVLRGGNRRVRELLGAVRDFDQADLLLLLIAVRQMASRDAGVTIDELIAACARIGRDEAWVRAALDALQRQQAILVSKVVRCLHLMAAGSILEVGLGLFTGEQYKHAVILIQETLRDDAVTLSGVSWLLHRLWSPHEHGVVTGAIREQLIGRCFAARTHVEIRDACFVLERLLGRKDPEVLAQVMARQDLLRTWILGSDTTDAYAIGGVLNNVRNDSEKSAKELVTAIDPALLARKVGLASLEDGYVWGTFLSRLAIGKKDDWSGALAEHLPRDVIRSAVKGVLPAQLADVVEYIQGLAAFDLDFAHELLELAAPFFAREMGRDSLATYREIHDLSFWVLGEGLFGDATPSERQRLISKSIFDGVRPDEVVDGILSCRYGDWENYARILGWVREAHPAKHQAIVEAMDWTRFDAVASDKLEIPGREFTLILAHLRLNNENHEPVSSWLRTRAGRMRKVNSRVVAICPEAAVAVLAQGGSVDLTYDHVSWSVDAYVIGATAKLDENTAKQIVRSNTQHFATGIAELSFPEGMKDLLILLAEEPDLFDAIMARVDLGVAHERWPRALSDKRQEWRQGAREALDFLAQREKGELGQLAARMLRQAQSGAPVATEEKEAVQ